MCADESEYSAAVRLHNEHEADGKGARGLKKSRWLPHPHAPTTGKGGATNREIDGSWWYSYIYVSSMRRDGSGHSSKDESQAIMGYAGLASLKMHFNAELQQLRSRGGIGYGKLALPREKQAMLDMWLLPGICSAANALHEGPQA